MLLYKRTNTNRSYVIYLSSSNKPLSLSKLNHSCQRLSDDEIACLTAKTSCAAERIGRLKRYNIFL